MSEILSNTLGSDLDFDCSKLLFAGFELKRRKGPLM